MGFRQVAQNTVPVSITSLAFMKAKEEVKAEDLHFRGTKNAPAFDEGDWEAFVTPSIPVTKAKSRGKGQERRRARQLTASAAES